MQWWVDTGRNQTVLCCCWTWGMEVWHIMWFVWYPHYHSGSYFLQYEEEGKCSFQSITKLTLWPVFFCATGLVMFELIILCVYWFTCELFAIFLLMHQFSNVYFSIWFRLIGSLKRWGRLTSQSVLCMETCHKRKEMSLWRSSDLVQGKGLKSSECVKWIVLFF